MAVLVGTLNVLLGIVYTSYGVMTLVDMKRGWHQFGFSHFGAAWVAMAFTCGPHHLIHGLHNLFEGRPGGSLDAFVVIVGLPAGATWFLLRLEAFVGGRGDRFVPGTPNAIRTLPTLAGMYLTALAFGTFAVLQRGVRPVSYAAPNAALIVIYCAIGWLLLRTQLANRGREGGWSVSGLALTIVFPTCAMMHAVHAIYTSTGRYAFDVHGFVIDWLGVPAAIYFLWVVRSLYNQSIVDWNSSLPAEARVS